LAAATGLHRNTITNIEFGRYAGDVLHEGWRRIHRWGRRWARCAP